MSDFRKAPANGRAGGDSEQIQSHLNDLEEKKRLQKELADFLHQQTEKDFDGARLDALLDALDKVDPLPEVEAIDTQKSLKAFRTAHADLFSAAETKTAKTIDSSPEKKHFKRRIFSIAAIAAVLIVVLTFWASAFDFTIFGVTVHWDSGRFWLSDSTVATAIIQARPLAVGETATYDTLEEALDAFGIVAPVAPQQMPERFEPAGATAVYTSVGILIYADYVSSDGTFQIRYKETTGFDYSSLEKDGKTVELYICGSLEYYLLYDLGYEKVFWQNGELECRMFGNVSRQEMKEIVDSIY